MRTIISFVIISSLILAGAILAAMASPRQHPVVPYQPIASRYLPGNPLPQYSQCDWHHYAPEDNTVLCHVYSQADVEITFLFDVFLKRITDSSIETPNLTIGELILAWNTPTGSNTDGSAWSVYWPGRYAYIVDNTFSPTSSVGFVSYVRAMPSYDPWQGFAHHNLPE